MTEVNRSSQSVIPHDVVLYQLVGALSFTENRDLWEKGSEAAEQLKSVGGGSRTIDLRDSGTSGAVYAFTTGLVIFSFYIYSHIGKQYMTIERVDGSTNVSIAFFDGTRFSFDPWKQSNAMLAFFEKSFSLLCGANLPVLTHDMFSQISRMFEATHERFEREVTLLKKILRSGLLQTDLVEKDSFDPNVFSLVLSALPAQELNSLFMIIGRACSVEQSVITVNGASINAREFLTRDTVDLFELFNKIRFLIVLYTEQKDAFFHMLRQQDVQSYLRYLASNESIERSVKSHIQDTIDGQYIPRVKTMKAFQRILRQ